MDPDAALTELRNAADLILMEQTPPSVREHIAQEMAEHFQALDGWLTAGGFPPIPWKSS